MRPGYRVCTVAGCPELTEGGGRCPAHRAQADRARGTSASRGYSGKGHETFRRGVLARDPVCVLCRRRRSAHADHWPLSREQLVLKGLNPNDPANGRGLCHSCHSRETVLNQGSSFG